MAGADVDPGGGAEPLFLMLPFSARPYMIRAIYDWCVHEGHTPYLLVATEVPGVRVPEGYGKDGKITLNVGPRAVQNLDLGDDRVRFSARFGGQHREVEVPIKALVAVFAAETHEGLVFGEPDISEGPAGAPENQAEAEQERDQEEAFAETRKRIREVEKKAKTRAAKSSDASAGKAAAKANGESEAKPESKPEAKPEPKPGGPDDEPPKGGPRLRLVK